MIHSLWYTKGALVCVLPYRSVLSNYINNKKKLSEGYSSSYRMHTLTSIFFLYFLIFPRDKVLGHILQNQRYCYIVTCLWYIEKDRTLFLMKGKISGPEQEAKYLYVEPQQPITARCVLHTVHRSVNSADDRWEMPPTGTFHLCSSRVIMNIIPVWPKIVC